MDRPGVGCGAVVLRGGDILLVHRRRSPEAGSWSIPGGKVDLFEHLTDTVVREVEEETGVRITRLEPLGVAELIDPETGAHWVSPLFLALDHTGEAGLREPDKHAACGWHPIDAPPEPLSVFARQALEALRRRGPPPPG